MVFYMADGTTVSVAPKFTGSSYLDTASGNVGTILGVDDEDMPIIHELLRVWREKYPRNLIRGLLRLQGTIQRLRNLHPRPDQKQGRRR